MNVDQKIHQLETQLEGLQSELKQLKSFVQQNQAPSYQPFNEQRNVEKVPPQQSVNLQPAKHQPLPKQPIHNNHDNLNAKTSIPNVTCTTSKPQPKQTMKDSSRNLETLLGKYFMGIAASVLIFIGLILFGVLIYRDFNETLRMISLYGISAIILIAGLILLRKRKNPFFLSIVGCGLGAFYICFILTYTYFHRINHITLYGILVLWAVAVLFISRIYQADMITVIGQCGILIASLFGLDNMTIPLEFLLIVCFMIIGTLLYMIPLMNQIKKTVLHFMIVSSSVLLIIASYEFRDARFDESLINDIGLILLMLYIGFLLVFFLRRVLNASLYSQILFSVHLLFLIIASGTFIYSMNWIPSSGALTGSILLIWFLVIWVTIALHKIPKASRVVSFIMLVVTMIILYNIELDNVADIIGYSVFYMPLFLYGYYKKDKLYLNGGYTVYGLSIFAFQFAPDKFIPIVSITGATLIIIGILLFMVKELYRFEYKLLQYVYFIMYGIFTYFLLADNFKLFSSEILYASIIILFILSMVTVLLYYCGWLKNPCTGEIEKDTEKLLVIAIQLFLVYGIRLCYADRLSYAVHFILVLCLSVLSAIGMKRFVHRIGIQDGSLFLAIKYTVYILLIFHSFVKHEQTITSIISLLIALACILLGFRLGTKKLRLYGLILSMVATLKLVLIDITYSDTVTRMISFFVCGILCFFINFIYNVAVKKYEHQEASIDVAPDNSRTSNISEESSKPDSQNEG